MMDHVIPSSPDRIRIIENFVEPEDLAVLDDLCRNPSGQQWWENKSVPSEEYVNCAIGEYKKVCEKRRKEWSCPTYHPLLKKYMEKLQKIMSYEVGHRLVPIFDFCWMTTPDGGSCPGHTDAEGLGPSGTTYMPEYSPLHIYEPNLIDMSTNIYVNNDYSGGQLHFPEYGITVEHTPGQLVWFPGSLEYLHAVHSNIGAPRWNIISHFARPKLIEMHSMIHNLYVELTEDQKLKFPKSWDADSNPRGISEGNQ
jgi:hypothetical protein